MEGAYPVLSGAMAQEKRLELITNNLANLNTTGFKRDHAVFGVVQAAGAGLVGAETPSAEVPPVFNALAMVATDFGPGAIRTTGDPLDLAIDGEGFFVVETPNGPRYTRDGHFTLDTEGRVVTMSGYPVLGSGGAITLPVGTVAVDSDGRMTVDGAEVDTVRVVEVSDPTRLRKVGDNVFEGGGQSETEVVGRIRPGALESSNVNPVAEMTAMIEVMRLYEAAQRAIQTTDAVVGKAVNEVGRTA
ncbi:MAG: flagellar basal-body rod protein FlgF [Nitrospirota bacterium]